MRGAEARGTNGVSGSGTSSGPRRGASSGGSRRRASSGHRRAEQRTRARRGGTAPVWRRLLKLLKQALARLGPRLRKRVLAALAAQQVPGPARALVRGLLDPEQRDFWFWWMAVTFGVALLVGLLIAVALAPVSALVALAALGIWAVARKVGTRTQPSAT